MAKHDYVSDAPKGKKNPYAKKAAPQEHKLPLRTKLIAFFTLAAIVGFAYFLWSIKDSKPPKATAKTKQEQEVELPPPPQEEWIYIDELAADKEVEGGKYEVTQGGPYKLQCGSFRTQQQAEVLKANIGFAGFRAQIKASTAKSGTTWHKVFLGPYQRKRAAENDKNKLKHNNINHCKIWLWQ